MFSLLFISSAYSDDSREKMNNYFSKTCSQIGPQLPDLDELKQIIKSGVNLNYEFQPGFPNVLCRLGGVAYKASDLPKDQVDKRMKDLLDTLVNGGLVIKSNSTENIYPAINEDMCNYLDALMQYGCDLSKIDIGTINDPEMVNAIDLADKWGYDDLVEIFMKHGSKTQSEEVRAQLRLVGGAEKLKMLQITDAIRRGAEINAPDIFGETALQELLKSNSITTEEGINVLKFLLDLRANPNIRYKNGDYPLYSFIEDKGGLRRVINYNGYDIKVISMLIKSGALVSSKNGLFKRTPLHAAAEKNYYTAARILVENGAKIMALDETGKTPLDLTESGEIIKLLKDNGAIERGY